MKAIKAAAVQAAPVYLNLDASIAKAAEIVSEAARNGAKLVAFPETWLPGYPFFVWLGAPVEGIRFIPQYHANSVELHSSEMKRLQKIAAANEITLVMGYSEREGGSRYMSQVIIGEQGEILLNRRKLKPTHVERTVYGEGDGSDLRVVDAAFGRLGALKLLGTHAAAAQDGHVFVSLRKSTSLPGRLSASTARWLTHLGRKSTMEQAGSMPSKAALMCWRPARSSIRRFSIFSQPHLKRGFS